MADRESFASPPTPDGLQLERLDLRERLAAIVAELEILNPDVVDVPLTLAQGLLEDIDGLTCGRRPA